MAGKVKGLTVEIGGDTTKLGKALQDVDKSAKSLQKELKGVNTLLKYDTGNVTLLKQKQELLNQSIVKTKERLDTLKGAQKSVQEQFDKGKITEEQYRDFQREIAATEQKLKDLKSEAADFGSVMSQQLQIAGEKVKDFGEDVVNVGKKFAPVSAAAAGVLTVTGKMASGFEDAMAKLNAIADTTKVPLSELEKQIMSLSDQTGIGAVIIANATYDAISAGQDTADAVLFIENATKLARAGFTETANSLDILTTILNSYGLASSEAGRISDILINTQNLGKVTVDELSASMGKVIPTAKANGVEIEQVAAAYALMTTQGVRARETTTYLNAMLTELGKSGTKSSKALKAATGKTFTELMEGGASLSDVLNILNEQAAKNGISLQDMFGSTQAARAGLLLLRGDGEDFNNMLSSMENSLGATDEAFTKLDTTSYKLQKAVNLVKNSAIDLGTTLLIMIAPIIEMIGEKVRQLCDWFRGLDEGTKQNIIRFLGIVAAIAPVLIILGKLIIGIGSLITACGKIIPVAKKVALIMKGLNATFLANPIFLIIAAIAALVAGFIYLWKNCEGFRNFWIKLWETIKNACLAAWDWIKKAWSSIGTFFTDLWANIKRIFFASIDWIVKTFNTAKSTVIQFFVDIWQGIKNAWSSVKEWFYNLFTATIEGIKNIWNGILDFFRGLWAGFISILEFFGIKDFIFSVFGVAYDIVVSIWNVAGIFFSWVWDQIKAVFFGVVAFYVGIFSAAWDGIKAIWSKVSGWFASVWAAIVAVWNVVAKWFTDKFRAAWEGIKAAWSVVASWFGALWERIKAIYNGVVQYFSAIFSRAWEVIKAVWSVVASWFGDVWNKIKAVFTPVAQWFTSIFSSAWEGIKRAFSGFTTFFSGLYNKLKETFKSIGVVVGDSISGALKSVVNGAISMAQRVVNSSVDLINKALRALNKLPGVKIRELSGVNFPRLRRGGVLHEGDAMVAEAGSPEMVSMMNGKAVVTPLTQREKMRVLNERDGQSVVMTDNTPIVDKLEQVLDVLARYLPHNELQMVLDTGVLVGELTPRIDRRLGINSELKRRGR